MSYFIIGFVLLLIIAPILSALPSKNQKLKMKKRQTAMAAGVRVDLAHIDDPDPDPERYLSNTGKPLERKLAVVAYRYHHRQLEQQEIRTEAQSSDSAFPAGRDSKTGKDWQFDRIEGVEENKFTRNWQFVDTNVDEFSETFSDFLKTSLSRMPDDVVRVERKHKLISVYWQESAAVEPLLEFLKAVATQRG